MEHRPRRLQRDVNGYNYCFSNAKAGHGGKFRRSMANCDGSSNLLSFLLQLWNCRALAGKDFRRFYFDRSLLHDDGGLRGRLGYEDVGGGREAQTGEID